VYDPKLAVNLWRSIIASSLGSTLYPYCLWIKSLRLGNLHELLEGLAKDANRSHSDVFFSPPLAPFRIEMATRVTRKFKGQLMDIDAIVVHAADTITDFIKNSADQANKAVTLTSLEGYNLRTARLSSWVSNLSQLTSLSVRDGSVLSAQVGAAIRENCPAFREV
jgi:hypothetical protein